MARQSVKAPGPLVSLTEKACLQIVPMLPSPKKAGGLSLKSVFNLSRSYQQLQVGFGNVCRCVQGVEVVSQFGLVLFGRSTRDLIPSQVSRKESQTIILTSSKPVGCLTH